MCKLHLIYELPLEILYFELLTLQQVFRSLEEPVFVCMMLVLRNLIIDQHTVLIEAVPQPFLGIAGVVLCQIAHLQVLIQRLRLAAVCLSVDVPMQVYVFAEPAHLLHRPKVMNQLLKPTLEGFQQRLQPMPLRDRNRRIVEDFELLASSPKSAAVQQMLGYLIS